MLYARSVSTACSYSLSHSVSTEAREAIPGLNISCAVDISPCVPETILTGGGGARNVRDLEWRNFRCGENLVRRKFAPILKYHSKIRYKIPRLWHKNKLGREGGSHFLRAFGWLLLFLGCSYRSARPSAVPDGGGDEEQANFGMAKVGTTKVCQIMPRHLMIRSHFSRCHLKRSWHAHSHCAAHSAGTRGCAGCGMVCRLRVSGAQYLAY